MNILVLTKRYTSAKDISREDVGRPYCLFAALRDCGHRVTFFLGDYTDRDTKDVEREGVGFRIRPLGLALIPAFRRALERELSEGRYDLLIAEGDPLFALIARGPCGRLGIPFVYDLMDNYATYAIYRIPLFRLLDQALVRRADLVVCVTDALRKRILPLRENGVCVVGNGVNTAQFSPLDRMTCRKRLSLPEGLPLIGYFGYLVGYKGIDLLLEAQRLLRGEGFRSLLVLAGDTHAAVKLPDEDVLYRGIVPQSDIPLYINACDAVAVPSPSNAYTDYCFPLKVLEGLACNVPVVASALGPVRELLGESYAWLFEPGDPRDLAAKMRSACAGAAAPDLRALALRHRWVDAAGELSEALGGLCAEREIQSD